MAQTLFLILALSLWTLGLYMASYEGQLLHGLFRRLDRYEGLNKPLLGCPYCMPSVHGFFMVALFHGEHWAYCPHAHSWGWLVAQWLLVAAAASALNCLLYPLIEGLRRWAWDEKPAPCAEVADIVVTQK